MFFQVLLMQVPREQHWLDSQSLRRKLLPIHTLSSEILQRTAPLMCMVLLSSRSLPRKPEALTIWCWSVWWILVWRASVINWSVCCLFGTWVISLSGLWKGTSYACIDSRSTNIMGNHRYSIVVTQSNLSLQSLVELNKLCLSVHNSDIHSLLCMTYITCFKDKQLFQKFQRPPLEKKNWWGTVPNALYSNTTLYVLWNTFVKLKS